MSVPTIKSAADDLNFLFNSWICGAQSSLFQFLNKNGLANMAVTNKWESPRAVLAFRKFFGLKMHDQAKFFHIYVRYKSNKVLSQTNFYLCILHNQYILDIKILIS